MRLALLGLIVALAVAAIIVLAGADPDSTSVGRTVERDPVVSALIERLERRADTQGRRS